jgi:PAS domain S-box-containing protein
MTFAENSSLRVMQVASWGFPLFLLLLALPVLPILWAGFALDSLLPSEYFTLAIGVELQSPSLAVLAFIGGLSAASGAIMVTTLALASMCLKHIILPLYRPSADRDIYRWLLWIRRVLIICIILAGYTFFQFIVGREPLSSLGFASFIASLQFLPGILATLYWQKANRKGLIAGLAVGFGLWFFMLLLPIISEFNPSIISQLYFNYRFEDLWSAATIMSLGCNAIVFIAVSLLTHTSEEEIATAQVCATDDLSRPTRRILSIQSPQEMKQQLSYALGLRSAEREVNRALQELDMTETETRPFALRRLRYRLEANLSSLLGPSVAHEMVEQLLPYTEANDNDSDEDINLIEGQLEHYKTHLTGLAADLDNLRRYHRQTLQDLPVGVCSLGRDREVLMWNHSLAELTGIGTHEVIGSLLSSLPPPWDTLLRDFSNSPEPHLYKQRIEVDGNSRWINLHKATLNPSLNDGRVLVIEDATELQLLEDELTHSERLASIGRLAAGVAHEIGNPITGIACLAQNLRYDTDNPESLATAQEILQQTDRISKIVQTLVNFAHAGTEGNRHAAQAVNVKQCADEAIHLLALNKDAKAIKFENLCPEGVFILGDAQRLLQVLVNLLSNARDASPEDSPVMVDAHAEPHSVTLTVTDQGSGISAELQEQIFDPFFTTKEAGKGTGLGLSLVYSIIEDLGGSISVQSPADPIHGGSCFIIKLKPAAAPLNPW